MVKDTSIVCRRTILRAIIHKQLEWPILFKAVLSLHYGIFFLKSLCSFSQKLEYLV